jgi:anti-sigma regulatory factor (Ser/Thr protein kinase)/CheY-like chemotaxis protein
VGRILLIDPGEVLVKALKSSPLLDGHFLYTAAGDADALRRLRIRSYDVLLTSPRSSVEEDLVLIEEARLARPGVRPIVLASGAAKEEVIAALRSRVFAFFTEPLDPSEIADMTARALDAGLWKDGFEVVSAKPDWIALRVNCRVLTIERLVSFLSELSRDLPADRDGLMLAFREILVNAMEHGGRFDPDQVVEVAAVRTARAIVFYVKDPGHGFDPEKLTHAAISNPEDDPVAHAEARHELGLRPGGFGLLLVRRVVDEIILSERGNEVILIKHTR